MEAPVLDGYAMDFFEVRGYEEIESTSDVMGGYAVYQKSPECIIFLGFTGIKNRGLEHILAGASVRIEDNSGGSNFPWRIVYSFRDGMKFVAESSEDSRD